MDFLPSDKLHIAIPRPTRSKKGQALVEFVVVFMIFLMTAGFAVELGNYFRAKSLLNLATYSAARGYAVTQNIIYAKNCAEVYLNKIVPPSSILCHASTTPSFGAPFAITVGISYVPIVPWFNYFIPSNASKSSKNFYMESTVQMISD